MRRSIPFALLLLAGCGGPPVLVPVKGLVMIDHKPVADATVYFWPAGDSPKNFATRHAIGITDAQGRFLLHCGGGDEGVESGEYRVTFSRPISNKGKALPGDSKHEGDPAVESIPKPYSDHEHPENSPFLVSVSASNHDFSFDLPAP